MTKNVVQREDARIIIFYEFKDEGETPPAQARRPQSTATNSATDSDTHPAPDPWPLAPGAERP